MLLLAECADDIGDPQCARHIALGTLSCLTLLGSIYVIRTTFADSRSWSSKRIVVLMIASMMSLIATIHYFVLPNLVQLAYTIHLLAVSIYLYEGYFFGVIACAIFKRSTYLDHLLRPVLLFALAVMIGLYVWSLLKPDSMACKDPLWLMFVSGQFVVTLFMVLIGRQIVKKLDRMQLFGNSLMEKKMQLWRLVLVNFACTYVSLLVEILDWFVVEDICDQWVVGRPFLNAFISSSQRVVTLFVPLWSLLFIVFNWPGQSAPDHEPSAPDSATAYDVPPSTSFDKPRHIDVGSPTQNDMFYSNPFVPRSVLVHPSTPHTPSVILTPVSMSPPSDIENDSPINTALSRSFPAPRLSNGGDLSEHLLR
jgi:hypothetical protein